LLAFGGYRWLERVGRVVVVVFTACTLVATALALPELRFSSLWPDWGSLGRAELIFAAALVGWMPSAIDVSVWQSLWTLEKERTEHVGPRNPEGIEELMRILHLHLEKVG